MHDSYVKVPFWPLAVMMAIAMGVQGMYYSYISIAIFFDFTGSTLFTVSILETVPFLANFIVIFWIGKQVDRKRNHKAWFLISLAALSIGNVGFLLIYDFYPNPWVFILTLFPVSVLFGMTFTNGPAYVSFIRPEEKGRFMGFLVMYQSIGSFIGSAAGGILYAQFGIGSIFVASIFLPLAGIAVTAAFLQKTPPAATEQKKPEEKPRSLHAESKASLWENPVIQAGLIFEFLLWLGIGTFYKFFGIFYVQELHGPVQLVGLSAGLASLLGAIVGFGLGALADKKSPVIILAYAWGGYLVVFAGLFFQRDPTAAAIYWALPIYVEFIGMNKIIAERTSEDERNRGIAAATIARNAGSALGVLAGGILSFWLSLDQILAITLVLFIPSFFFLVKTKKNYGKSQESVT